MKRKRLWRRQQGGAPSASAASGFVQERRRAGLQERILLAIIGLPRRQRRQLVEMEMHRREHIQATQHIRGAAEETRHPPRLPGRRERTRTGCIGKGAKPAEPTRAGQRRSSVRGINWMAVLACGDFKRHFHSGDGSSDSELYCTKTCSEQDGTQLVVHSQAGLLWGIRLFSRRMLYTTNVVFELLLHAHEDEGAGV